MTPDVEIIEYAEAHCKACGWWGGAEDDVLAACRQADQHRCPEATP